MRVDLFDFELPRERIALEPASPRDAARLLHVARDGLHERIVRDLPSLLRAGDLLVVNDTRVIPARLRGRVGAGGIEVTLHRRLDEAAWLAFARPARKLRPGTRLDFADGFSAETLERREGGEVALRFSLAGAALMAALERHGEMPLPPYIGRDRALASDRDDYQTMFAASPGAVAAPTAGLHFTPALMTRLREAGISCASLTLHVGAGTFLPVKTDDISQHRMHAEWGEVTPAAAAAIAATRAAGGRVIPVGTTALRLIETAAQGGAIAPFRGETDIFITPGFRFRATDGLMTNFHLPRSTLMMLVSALMGRERMMQAYAHAVAQGYRFFSYGDASILLPGGLGATQ
ncbi:MAG TPA: tRNA preQ1(34) S-adenosylmethionine ribosyltransferase-isomerase QueA [Paracoccaceae bacterium]|nr:tRNA preQ1(34) S-adenosylmethionine ribosyltransferase-isomerase QueA [Paracoccaceae bacterium]